MDIRNSSFLAGNQVLAVVCNQWGDSGKGKIVDWLVEIWADINVRGTGGPNAGHTVVTPDGMEIICHVVPSGILHDSNGKVNVIGNGAVFSLEGLVKEMQELGKAGVTFNNFFVSKDAHLIFPYHLAEEKYLEDLLEIGTTRKGLGPTYTDKVGRFGIRVGDLFDKDIFRQKLETLKKIYQAHKVEIDVDKTIDAALPLFQEIKPFIRDTISLVHQFYNDGKKILLEGAQGTLLSIEYGTYPFCTSSDCSASGLAAGAGLSRDVPVFVLGVVKAPYMTRVGGGPFPTEFGGEDSVRWCSDKTHTKQYERELCVELERKLKEGSLTPLEIGILARSRGNEYGATTGRDRRTGMLDLFALAYCLMINGPNLVITKPDVMSGFPFFDVCTGYTWDGPQTETYMGVLKPGDNIPSFPAEPHLLRHCKPVYSRFKGYGSLEGIDDYHALPVPLKNIFRRMEGIGAQIHLVSTGRRRDQIICRR